MSKKIVAIIVALLVVTVVFTACATTPAASSAAAPASSAAPAASSAAPASSAAAPASSAAAAKGKGFTIGYLGWDNTTDWEAATLGGLQWGAEKYGCKVVVMDAKQKPETQLNQAEQLIAQKVDIIGIFPTTPEAAATIARQCNDAGIPIVVENTFLPEDGSAGQIVGQVACQYHDIGYAAIKYAATKYPGCKLLYVHGGAGMGVYEDYKVGVDKALEEFKDKITMVGSVDGKWVTEDSYKVTQDFIQSGKSDFDVVFANNDAQLKGVYQALKEVGKESIPILSTGGSGEGYDMLVAGTEAANMTAPANIQGIIEFKYMLAYMNGIAIKQTKTPLPVIPVDKDNIKEWIKWSDMDAAYKYVSDNYGPFEPAA